MYIYIINLLRSMQHGRLSGSILTYISILHTYYVCVKLFFIKKKIMENYLRDNCRKLFERYKKLYADKYGEIIVERLR